MNRIESTRKSETVPNDIDDVDGFHPSAGLVFRHTYSVPSTPITNHDLPLYFAFAASLLTVSGAGCSTLVWIAVLSISSARRSGDVSTLIWIASSFLNFIRASVWGLYVALNKHLGGNVQ